MVKTPPTNKPPRRAAVLWSTPVEDETPSDVMAPLLHKEPLPLVRYSPDVPRAIVSKALPKDKEERSVACGLRHRWLILTQLI
jgi:hypothetical protein